MILMKPNRNYFKSQTKELYKYVAFDYLNQVMSVSMREDKEFNDNVTLKSKIDLNHKQEIRVDLTMDSYDEALKNSQEPQDFNGTFSKQMQTLRNGLMDKLDSNRLLQKLLAEDLGKQKALEN